MFLSISFSTKAYSNITLLYSATKYLSLSLSNSSRRSDVSFDSPPKFIPISLYFTLIVIVHRQTRETRDKVSKFLQFYFNDRLFFPFRSPLERLLQSLYFTLLRHKVNLNPSNSFSTIDHYFPFFTQHKIVKWQAS